MARSLPFTFSQAQARRERYPAPFYVYDEAWNTNCENNGKSAVNRALPKIDRGDILVISGGGVHGHSMGYHCSGKLRRAETPADYLAALDVDSTFPGAEGLL